MSPAFQESLEGNELLMNSHGLSISFYLFPYSANLTRQKFAITTLSLSDTRTRKFYFTLTRSTTP